MTENATITLTHDTALTPSQVEQVARHSARLELSESGADAINRCRTQLEKVLDDGLPHYGINTGFGSLSRKQIQADELEQLQLNLIRSHAAGVGEPLPDDVVRAMMLVLAASLTRGYSGVRLEIVEQIITLLNAGITPVVPESGSVGASGDLAPLSHFALSDQSKG
ncbi:MAG: aromatic amino acid lyase, partial [Phycisphaerales bacterium]